MADGEPPLSRKAPRLSDETLQQMPKEELVRHWKEQERYITTLEERQASVQEAELASLRESEEKLRQQQLEATRRENVLVMRLTTKEQEMQDYANQINELKAAQAPGAMALRSSLLDPAINLMLQRMKKELDDTKAKMEETQNELSAWKFTPDSNTGKRLMAKCRLLYQENEELGRMISSGRLAKLEGDLALQKNFSEEMKKSQSELDEFIQELDEDVEGMQSTIYYLQQQLREAKDLITKLQEENEKLQKSLRQSQESVRTEPTNPTPPTSNHESSSWTPSAVVIKSEESSSPQPAEEKLGGPRNGLKDEVEEEEEEEMVVEAEAWPSAETCSNSRDSEGNPIQENGNHQPACDLRTEEGEGKTNEGKVEKEDKAEENAEEAVSNSNLETSTPSLKRTHEEETENVEEGRTDGNVLKRDAKRLKQDEDLESGTEGRLVITNGMVGPQEDNQ